MQTPTTILSPTETVTPQDKEICCTFSGVYVLICVKYTNTPILVQTKRPDDPKWYDAEFDGTPIQITQQAESLNLPIVPFCAYRVKTETAGAEVAAFAGV